MSLFLISHPPFCHQTVGNKHAQLKVTFVMSLSPLFMSPDCNVNVIIEGRCDIQRFLTFVAHFANFLHVDAESLFLLIPIHHRLEMWQLLNIHMLSL
jgi:hypothetical protein